MQTLYDYRKRNPTFITGLTAIEKMPEFCSLITNAIMMWPMIEQSMQSMLASIVGTEAVTVVAMHTVLLSESSKEQALQAAAKTKLTDEDFVLLKIIMKLTKTALKDRHIFAHWIPAYSPEVPDALLFLQLEDTTDQMVSIYYNSYSEPTRRIPTVLIDHKDVRVYRLEDAARACERLKECHRYIDTFGAYHHLKKLRPEIISGMRPAPQPHRFREWLLAQPQIQESLQRKHTTKTLRANLHES